MKTLAALVLLAACGPDAPTPIYRVPVVCWQGCADLSGGGGWLDDTRRPDEAPEHTDVQVGTAAATWPLCLYGWRELRGRATWEHPYRAARLSEREYFCAMPAGQTALLGYFYDDAGAEVVIELTLTPPFLPGAKELPGG